MSKEVELFIAVPKSGAAVGAFAGLIFVCGPELCTAAVETEKRAARAELYKVGVTQGWLEDSEEAAG